MSSGVYIMPICTYVDKFTQEETKKQKKQNAEDN